jgi:hypothetical protein
MPRDETAPQPVPREAYLVSRKQRCGRILSILRFTLHEIRATQIAAADWLRLDSQGRTIAAEVLMNNAG